MCLLLLSDYLRRRKANVCCPCLVCLASRPGSPMEAAFISRTSPEGQRVLTWRLLLVKEPLLSQVFLPLLSAAHAYQTHAHHAARRSLPGHLDATYLTLSTHTALTREWPLAPQKDMRHFLHSAFTHFTLRKFNIMITTEEKTIHLF